MTRYVKGKESPLEQNQSIDLWSSKEFLKERQRVFNFLLKVSKKLLLSNKNLFKTFMLFDHYYSVIGMNGSDYLKYGVVCLFIMTKYEDGKILSHSLYGDFFNGNLTIQEYHQIEGDILYTVGFKINYETLIESHCLLETQIQIDQTQKELVLELYYYLVLCGFVYIKPYYVSLACNILVLQND